MGDAYRDEEVHVLAEQCDTCVFRPGNLMHLEPGRLERMVRENLDGDTAFACHQTLPYGTHECEGESICRGFFNRHKFDVLPLRLGVMLGVIVEDPVPVKKRRVGE